jgi:uncharacterized protein involved in type VI secretion and phage assembly
MGMDVMDLLSMSDDDGKEKERDGKIPGITTGVVKENWDKEKKYPGMVRVEFFLGETGKTLTEWVRVAQNYAGNGYGNYWLPEVGDEVILAFNLGDINSPYVIGAVWNNAKDKIPAETVNEKNTVKRIKTKGGHEIIFNEEEKKEKIEIHTPGKLKIALEDENQIIVIQDEKGENMFKMDCKKGEITVSSKKISFDANKGGATLELDGEGKSATLKANKVTVEGAQSLELSGKSSLKAEGNMVELSGKGSFKVNCDAVLELKGKMAKIN